MTKEQIDEMRNMLEMDSALLQTTMKSQEELVELAILVETELSEKTLGVLEEKLPNHEQKLQELNTSLAEINKKIGELGKPKQ